MNDKTKDVVESAVRSEVDDPIAIRKEITNRGLQWSFCEKMMENSIASRMMDSSTVRETRDGNRSQRPGFRNIYMRLAEALAERSTCRRLQVGTVITSLDFRQVLAVGYNGNAAGLDNDCDSDEPGRCGCLHSEENAIINCSAPRAAPKVVFVTHTPCLLCAKRLINLGGVKIVYWANEYRSDAGEKLLQAAGIPATILGRA